MAATAGKTGKAGNITLGGTVVPITKANPKVNVEFADATDSGGYDSPSGNLFKSQLPGDTQIELSIEGYWDANTFSSVITSKVQNPSGGPYAMVVKLDGSTTYCSGNFDLSDLDTSLTVAGAAMIAWTMNAKSNGKYILT